MRTELKNNRLIIYFSEELDNYAITQLKDECIKLIEKEKPAALCFDFRDVTFVDSTGIGFLLARYKQCQKLGIAMSVANLSKNNRALFAMSGIFQLIREERNEGNDE